MTSEKLSNTFMGYVDVERGLLSREIFVNEEIYAQEQERIFARSWLFLGHESQIAKSGDYFVSRMGEESVIMTRDRKGEIHVFLNSCMHRGMKVCRYDEGNTPVFTCPYHGWSYGLDGSLVGVPYFKEAYHSELKKEDWGLREVAQLANYKGTIWATWDKDAPSFEEYLGGMKFYLDLMLDGRDGSEGGSELLMGVQKWETPCNWKFPQEQFSGDNYHGIPTHRSVDLSGIGPSGKGRRDDEGGARPMRVYATIPGRGHGGQVSFRPEDAEYVPTFQNTPVVADYFRQVYEERRRRLGTKAQIIPGVGNVFPNGGFLPLQPRVFGIHHPAGPYRTQAWRLYLVDKSAPEEVKEVLRHYFMRYSGPGGMTEQDDMEAWNYVTAASKGTIARRHPYNYQMGLGGKQIENQGVPGRTSQANFSEQNQRGFYKRWAAFMSSDDWGGRLSDQ